MRTFLIAALLAACAIPAQASVAPDPRDLVGAYQLSDGRTLLVSKAGRRLYVQLDGYRTEEIVPAGGDSFIARSGDLRLDFVQHANGSVSAVTLRIAARGRGK